MEQKLLKIKKKLKLQSLFVIDIVFKYQISMKKIRFVQNNCLNQEEPLKLESILVAFVDEECFYKNYFLFNWFQ